jgi:hypothetical protein
MRRCLGIILILLLILVCAPFLISVTFGLLIPDAPPRAYRNNQREELRDGRSVDLIFKGHDALDGSFIVQTSKGKGPFKKILKSRPMALAAEPDLRILPSGKAVIFVKSESGKESSPIALDEFLEGVVNESDYK